MNSNFKLKIMVLGIAYAIAATGSVAYAAKGTPGGGGGRPGEETSAQNLSVPTIMVGGVVGGLTCGTTPESPSGLVLPMGDPLTGYELSGYYYVQKVHTWQAQCLSDLEAQVYGAWGDNLAGDAKLKVGSPIRVELVLENRQSYSGLEALQGYDLKKLEPSKLDRESAYGHAALGGPDTGFEDNPIPFGPMSWLVHDAGITFSIQNLATGAYTVSPGTSPTAEINATGKVVYGYNLRVGVAGPYRITFTSSPAVDFVGADAGTVADSNNVYLDINIVSGGGGGGGGGGGKGKPR